MQSNNLKILMISYGRGALYENKAGVLDRHIEYASYFESLEILYLTKKKLNNLNFGKLKITPVFGFSYLICLFKALFKNFKNYQIVTTQDPFITGILGLYYKKKFGIKLHVQNHSNFIDNRFWINENKIRNTLLNFLAKKKVLPNADRLRVVNSFEKQVYIQNLSIPENKIDIAPIDVNSIFYSDVSENEILNFIEKYSIDRNKIILGWAGRFVRLKRLDYLFELVASLKNTIDAQLVLAGDFNNSDFDLELLEKKYSLKPIYTGQLEPNELVKFYHTLNVFVLTSEYEGYGLVLKEALVTGCPVLVSNNSMGPKDIIKQDSNGYLFSNYLEFEEKINHILNNKLVKNKNRSTQEIIIESIKKTLWKIFFLFLEPDQK